MKNFREPTSKLFRSEMLINLTDDDIEFIKKNNIKIVVDLRTPEERIKLPDVEIEGIKNISIPLLGKDEDTEKEPKLITIGKFQLPDMSAIYREMVSLKRKDAWSSIFKLLESNKGEGILFHCSGGKDRTGVVFAVVLSSLGFSKEDIYRDYLKTNENPIISPDFQQFLDALDEETRKAILLYSGANKEYLDATFDEINKLYGSLDNFLLEVKN